MGFEKTLAAATATATGTGSNLLLCTVPKHSTLPKSLVPTSNQVQFSRTFRSSASYYSQYNSHAVSAVEYPKPSEIPWKKELCNTVHFIGNVGAPVEIKHLSSGKVVAWTRLAVKKSATETSWINLTFWDELAQVAFQHVDKGHQIYVSGRLVTDVIENDDGKMQTYYKVSVQQLNFIERSSSSTVPYTHDPNGTLGGSKLGKTTANHKSSTTELWQAFFANPLEWWDNRKNKRNPKYPDFKHKDTGEALWVDGRYNPPWVKSQLEILDERMGTRGDQDNRMQLSSMLGDNFTHL